jgi:hypothetical protein
MSAGGFKNDARWLPWGYPNDQFGDPLTIVVELFSSYSVSC